MGVGKKGSFELVNLVLMEGKLELVRDPLPAHKKNQGWGEKKERKERKEMTECPLDPNLKIKIKPKKKKKNEKGLDSFAVQQSKYNYQGET